MTPALLEMLVPIVAILVTFAFPVALVFTFKWFKLKEKELQVEADMRRTAGEALEARVQRLESVILALDADLRARITAGAAPRSELFEGPATEESGQPGALSGPSIKTR